MEDRRLLGSDPHIWTKRTETTKNAPDPYSTSISFRRLGLPPELLLKAAT